MSKLANMPLYTVDNNGQLTSTQPNSNIVYYPATNQGSNMFSSTTAKIIPALIRAKFNMGAAIKDAANPFFKSKYADLNAVKAACEPALANEKIAVFQPTVQKDGKNYVQTLLLHESGEWFSADTEIVCAKANDPQALGSAITYARRYGLQSLVGLGAEDDDGEGAMNRSSSPAVSAPKAPATRSSFKKPTAAPKPVAQPVTAKTEETTPDGWE